MQSIKRITVGARNSPLSRAQVNEIYEEIRAVDPRIAFDPRYIETKGDKDQKTSLREMERTDFFTEEIDKMLLEKKCRIAVHSAKDLPESIPKKLVIAAITKGVDSSDCLVFRSGDSLDTLFPNSIIATSSERRENTVKSLRKDLTFRDIRGNIGQRLEKLYSKEVDGVVIAKAALIRLQLLHVNWVTLSEDAAPLQGKLAVIIHEEDHDMKDLFSRIDTREFYEGSLSRS